MRVGDVIDEKYRLVKLIGEGGMGLVFEAEHMVIKRRLALKCLHTALASNKNIVERFVCEAQAAAAIGSEHIIEVTDGGRSDDGSPYLVMEYLEGEDLASLLRRQGRLAPERAVELAIQACEGLGAAHGAKIVHRDLKPENLWVESKPDGSDWVKVLDFGIAKFQDLSLTPTDATMGTPYYMAPEQAERATQVDERSDVYALGVILYEMLAGRRPFEGDSIKEIMAQILFEEAPPLAEVAPALPQELVQIVTRAMSREPAVRYSSMAALAEALGAETSYVTPPPENGSPKRGGATECRTPPTLVQGAAKGEPRRGVRGLMVPLLLIAGLVLGGGAVGLVNWFSRSQSTSAGLSPTSDTLSPDSGASADAAAPEGWVRIAAGTTRIGTPPDEVGRYDNEAMHDVTLSRPYLLATTEVTQLEWRRLMKSTPAEASSCGDDCPVENVNWYEALAYCNALSREHDLEECYDLSTCVGSSEGHLRCRQATWPRGLECGGYRLPTEAEWEHAARAGTPSATYLGNLGEGDEGCDLANAVLGPIAWFCGTSGNRPHPVGNKTPNPLGLFDMHGNVWEWVWDRYAEYPDGSQTDPLGAPAGDERVFRGGGWNSIVRQCRAGARAKRRPSFRSRSLGFRPARSLLSAR